jgi:hypothetical protein
VQPPDGQLRDYFLHALFLTDEGEEPEPVTERIEEKDKLGVRFQLGDRTVTARFNTAGPIGGHLTVRRAKEMLHDAPLPLIVSP